MLDASESNTDEQAIARFRQHQAHRARIALGLIWISSTVGMFIAVAFMLLLTDVNPKIWYFYIPVGAFALIMAVVIPLTAKITKHYLK